MGKKIDIGWIEGREDHNRRSGQGAENADRQDRGAWAGRKYKSPYAHLLNVPDRVGAGDRGVARTIMDRLDAVIEQGGWTGNEWARIHKMRGEWGRRAAGKDPVFNMSGWNRQHTGHNHSPVVRLMVDVRREIEK